MGVNFSFDSTVIWFENNIDPDQLAYQKPADQDLHCFSTL